MKYYHNLYLSEGFQEKKAEILDKLERKETQLNKYLVVLSKNSNNQLEIFESILLIQKIYEMDNLFVVGIADGYDGALEMIEKLTQEVYDITRGTDIRNYFLEKQRQFEEGIV